LELCPKECALGIYFVFNYLLIVIVH